MSAARETLVVVGTKKGLFMLRGDPGAGHWQVDGPLLGAGSVYSVGIDTRGLSPRILVGTHSEHWGPSVTWSDDLGKTWGEAEQAPVAFPPDTGAALARVWQLQPAGADQPGVVWAGTEPGALFRSRDGGETYSLVRALWDHPERPQWEAGFGGQAVHTVLPHPDDGDRVLVAVSTGGVYITEDGGESWNPSNTGIRVSFGPDEYPSFGQCVHKVDRSPARPEQLFLQNHGGVYRSNDSGASWEPAENGLPATFGFPVVAHPNRAGTAYVFPVVADAFRMPPGGAGRVYRTTDGGESWQPSGVGLPSEGFWSLALRDAFSSDAGDPLGLYLGTRSGEVWASGDEGDTWSLAVAHLPDVLTVRATVLSAA
jgi:photosystem II stability/assembly factor-like uncharacterized protein